MEKGLLWLPLLAIFFGLAWAGWHEYRKVEAYRLWAQGFEQAKYDILSVMGVSGQQITIGKPTRQGPVELQEFSLENIAAIRLLVGGQPIDLANLPKSGKAIVEFSSKDGKASLGVPFTDLELAAKWTDYLRKKLE